MALPEKDRTDERPARVRSKGVGIPADGTGGTPPGPREILERFRRASIGRSAEDLSGLYAVDAVHEFPFTAPGLPSRLEGREAIVAWIATGWQSHALTYERYRTVAVHDTGDPDTIVVEQQALGTHASTGEFALPNIVVLTVRDGKIVRLRDYVNILAAAAVMGDARSRPPSAVPTTATPP